MPRKGTTPIEQWAHNATFDLDLPSGARRKVKPVSLAQFIAYGRIPTDALTKMAIRVEYEGLGEDMTKLDVSDVQDYERLRDFAISEADQDPFVTPEWVRENLPAEDRETMWLAAIHGRNAPNVTTLLSYLKFRDGASGAAANGSGTDAGSGAE